jgi:lipoprotein-releasing system permease protein
VKYKDKVRGVSFIGDPLWKTLMRVEEDMVQGDYYDLVYKKRAAVLGTRLAEELELKMGDRFTLVRQNKSLRLEVVGLIQTGTGSDQTLVYLPLETAQELMGQGDVVSEIGARLSTYMQLLLSLRI